MADIQLAVEVIGFVQQGAGQQILAELECQDFAAAIALVNRIAEAAEQADHHPDILIHGYRRLTITLTTHAAGGLTQRDFALARAIDALVGP